MDGVDAGDVSGTGGDPSWCLRKCLTSMLAGMGCGGGGGAPLAWCGRVSGGQSAAKGCNEKRGEERRREEKRGEERRREEKATRGLVCLRRGKLRTVGEREKQGKGG